MTAAYGTAQTPQLVPSHPSRRKSGVCRGPRKHGRELGAPVSRALTQSDVRDRFLPIRKLRETIRRKPPQSLAEIAERTGRRKPNL